MKKYRMEKDLIGEKKIPAEALYGIHAARAVDNFPIALRPVNPSLIHAYGAVKLACAMTNHQLGQWDKNIYNAISAACSEMMEGRLDDNIIVDALQGGAGTSTNMNVNEAIANRALQIAGYEPGNYSVVSPLEDINLHQSTNDTYPSALKVAALNDLKILERALVKILEAFQKKEKQTSHIVKVGRTQMQDAVLTMMGRTMSSFAEAFGRDRWRVFKCSERLRVLNLGGTAIGTGLAAPRRYIFKVVENLKQITGHSLARAENMIEATQNTDCFVEVSGMLNACASNLLKCASDLRFMSSGPDAGIGELHLPEVQAGSSIMPGKVNPVIPEAATQVAVKVISNNSIISTVSGMGNLELNAFMPLIADTLLESIQLLARACSSLSSSCVEGLTVNESVCGAHVDTASAVITSLLDRIGYAKAQEIILEAGKKNGKTVKDIILREKLMTEEEFDLAVSPESVTCLGSRKKTFSR